MNNISIWLSLISLFISIIVAILNIFNHFRNIFFMPIKNQRMQYCLAIISTFQNIERYILDIKADENHIAFETLVSSKSKYIRNLFRLLYISLKKMGKSYDNNKFMAENKDFFEAMMEYEKLSSEIIENNNDSFVINDSKKCLALNKLLSSQFYVEKFMNKNKIRG